jgi:hypothetical protein
MSTHEKTMPLRSIVMTMAVAALGIQLVGCSGSAPYPAVDDGGIPSGVTGCAALTACCPELPVSEVPTECTAVAAGGTADACAESLASYQSAGYCLSLSGGGPSAAVSAILGCGEGFGPFDLGTPDSPVANGEESYGDPVTVRCSVEPMSGSYALDLFASVGTGSIQLTGTLADVSVAYQLPGMGTTTSGCSVQLEPGVQDAVTSGKIWGSLVCPDFVGGADDVCSPSVEFVFENCNQ